MIDIALLSWMIITEQIGSTDNIKILFGEMQLFGILKLDGKSLLIAQEIKTDQVIPGEKKDLILSNWT